MDASAWVAVVTVAVLERVSDGSHAHEASARRASLAAGRSFNSFQRSPCSNAPPRVRRRTERVRGAHRSPQAVVLSHFQLHDRRLSARLAFIERCRNS